MVSLVVLKTKNGDGSSWLPRIRAQLALTAKVPVLSSLPTRGALVYRLLTHSSHLWPCTGRLCFTSSALHNFSQPHKHRHRYHHLSDNVLWHHKWARFSTQTLSKPVSCTILYRIYRDKGFVLNRSTMDLAVARCAGPLPVCSRYPENSVSFILENPASRVPLTKAPELVKVKHLCWRKTTFITELLHFSYAIFFFILFKLYKKCIYDDNICKLNVF